MTEAFILCKRFAAWRRSLNKNRRPAHVRNARVNRLLLHIVSTRRRAAFALLSLLRREIHFARPRDASLLTSRIKLFANKRNNTTLRHQVRQQTLCVRKIHFFTILDSMWRCVEWTLSSMRME